MADFGQTAFSQTLLTTGTLTSTTPQILSTLQVGQSQLRHFALSGIVSGSSADTVIRLSIYDGSNRIVFAMDSVNGVTRTGQVFLLAGNYTLRISGSTRNRSALGTVAYTVKGAGLTGPIGPTPDDPTSRSIPTCSRHWCWRSPERCCRPAWA